MKISADFRNESDSSGVKNLKSPTSASGNMVINDSINTKGSFNRSKDNNSGNMRMTFNPDQYAGALRTQQMPESNKSNENS